MSLARISNPQLARRVRQNVLAAGLDGGVSLFAIAVELAFRKHGRCDMSTAEMASMLGLARQKCGRRRRQLVEAGIWAKPDDVDSFEEAVEFRATRMGDAWRPRTGSSVLDDPWPGLPDVEELPEDVRALEWDLDLERLVLTMESGADPLEGVDALRASLRAAAGSDGSRIESIPESESARPEALLRHRFGGDYRRAKRELAERICIRANTWASRPGKGRDLEFVLTLHPGGFPAWVDWLRDWVLQGGRMRGGLELRRSLVECGSAPTSAEMKAKQKWGGLK